MDAARAEGRPTLSLVASKYKTLTPQDESTVAQTVSGGSVGLQLKIPLFDGFARRSDVAIARAQLHEKEMDLAAAVRDVETETWNTQEALRRQMEGLSIAKEILQNSEAAVKASTTRYKNGVGSILELLKSQSDLVDAQKQLVKATSDWRAARVRFSVDTGTLNLPQLSSGQ